MGRCRQSEDEQFAEGVICLRLQRSERVLARFGTKIVVMVLVVWAIGHGQSVD